MSKVKIIFILSIWVIILPYLGFPYALKNILFSITGLVLTYLSYMLFSKIKVGEKIKTKTFDNFSENSDFKEENEAESVDVADQDKEQI